EEDVDGQEGAGEEDLDGEEDVDGQEGAGEEDLNGEEGTGQDDLNGQEGTGEDDLDGEEDADAQEGAGQEALDGEAGTGQEDNGKEDERSRALIFDRHREETGSPVGPVSSRLWTRARTRRVDGPMPRCAASVRWLGRSTSRRSDDGTA